MPEQTHTRESVELIIDKNAEIFDSKETLLVRPRPAYVKGKPDWSQCQIEVVARRPPELSLPKAIEGVPIIKVAATLEEQAVRFLALRGKTFTDAELASDWRTGLLSALTEAPRNYSHLTYKPFKPSRLVEVNEDCELILHASPDDAWPVLKDFLEGGDRYTVAMYDFTAPHIIEQFTTAGSNAAEVALCLSPGESLDKGKKANDWHEEDVIDHVKKELRKKFKFSWASVGLRRQFPSAYHIKVAVKDERDFWLSSGNWQSSNQPHQGFAGAMTGPAGKNGAEMALYNREWHVVVNQPTLAKIFEDYIAKDLDSSAVDEAETESGAPPVSASPEQLPPDFPPDDDFTLEFKIQPTPMLGIQEAPRPHRQAFARKVMVRKQRRIIPLLTPENYAEEVTRLLQQARHRLWFQNQSLAINLYPSKAYRELLDALKEKAHELDDVRIIFRDIRRAKTIDALRLLDRDGFPMDKIRAMGNCHTKGILIDSEITVIGSHNWTNEGTNYNRDASLIIHDPEVTAYYEEIVEHDWSHLSYPIDFDQETPVAVLPLPGEDVSGTAEQIDARLNEIDDG
jgi:hypothetical protein